MTNKEDEIMIATILFLVMAFVSLAAFLVFGIFTMFFEWGGLPGEFQRIERLPAPTCSVEADRFNCVCLEPEFEKLIDQQNDFDLKSGLLDNN